MDQRGDMDIKNYVIKEDKAIRIVSFIMTLAGVFMFLSPLHFLTIYFFKFWQRYGKYRNSYLLLGILTSFIILGFGFGYFIRLSLLLKLVGRNCDDNINIGLTT